MDKTSLYIERINVVIDYIDKNLDKNLDLEHLSTIACFSKYHFHRIFQSYTSESLYSFIKRLRVEKAAALLLNQNSTITTIALECGFNDGSTFSRAFKNHFNCTPSAWRKSKKSKNHQEKKHNIAYNKLSKSRLEALNISEVTFPKRYIKYIRHTGKYSGDYRLFAKLYYKLKSNIPEDISTKATIVIYHDFLDITDEDQLRLSMGIETKDTRKPSGEVGILSIRENTYVCVQFELDNTQYREAWKKVYRQILPQRGFLPADGYSYERYIPGCYDATTGKTIVEICVPVTKSTSY